jgi:S-adenosylmethionine synthetase
MQPINLKIQFTDGTEKQVSAIAADLIAFETRFDLSVARLESEIRLTHLFFLAYAASKRTGETDLQFEAWTETVTMVAEADAKK